MLVMIAAIINMFYQANIKIIINLVIITNINLIYKFPQSIIIRLKNMKYQKMI
jgi:hypothetical protein